jgi:hypothetical protein
MFPREQKPIFLEIRPNKFESPFVAAYFRTKPSRKRGFGPKGSGKGKCT